MTAAEAIQKLRDTIAPEANHILTEAPGPPKPPDDFGWFCREHAVVTSIFCQSFGHPVDVVRGDVSVIFPSGRRFTTVAAADHRKHWWCSGRLSPVLDLSLNLKHLGCPFLTSAAVVGINPNGPFTVIVTPDQSTHYVHYTTPHIIYEPHEVLPFSAHDLAHNPVQLIGGEQAAFITAQCCMHIDALLRGTTTSYIGRLDQGFALIDMFNLYRTAGYDIRRLV